MYTLYLDETNFSLFKGWQFILKRGVHNREYFSLIFGELGILSGFVLDSTLGNLYGLVDFYFTKWIKF